MPNAVDRDEPFRVLALDQSLTSFGFCEYTRTPSEGTLWEPDISVGTLSPKFDGVRRLAYFGKWITERVNDFDPHVIVMEGYSYGTPAGASHSHSLGELGGVLKVQMFWAEREPIVISPSSLKLWACGAGNAKKEAVLIAAVRAFGDVPRNNNEADAIWLAEIGYHHGVGTDPASLPNEAKRRVLRELAKSLAEKKGKGK